MLKFNKIEEAIKDIKAGKIIIIVDDENRENEGDLVCSANFATPENINFMAKYGRGLICMPISKKIAKKLDLNDMVSNNTDNHKTAFTVSIDSINTSTGISAFERSLTILEAINPNSKPSSFRRPGHIFPLISKTGGVLEREGHTEATVDISTLSGLSEAGVCCEIMSEDGHMMRGAKLFEFSKKHNLKIITIKDLIKYKTQKLTSMFKRTSKASLPTKYGDFDIYGYENNQNKEHHIALVMGNIKNNESILVRIHSECLTGDVFGSNKCDCGEQLEFSLETIHKEKKGIIIYLRQEGRGIGLINKIKAYKLQEDGLDTVDSNIALGFKPDLRDFSIAAHILNDLKVKNIKILTNNPEKINSLKNNGINIVERIPIEILNKNSCKKYMETKKSKLGHILKNY